MFLLIYVSVNLCFCLSIHFLVVCLTNFHLSVCFIIHKSFVQLSFYAPSQLFFVVAASNSSPSDVVAAAVVDVTSQVRPARLPVVDSVGVGVVEGVRE